MIADLLHQLTAQPLLVVLLMTAGAVVDSALGVGALLPGESLVATGATVLQGSHPLWPAWLSVAAGAFLGDHVGYAVGRRLGPAAADSAPVRRIGRGRWDRVTGRVRRHAVPTLALGRQAPGVRTLVALAAGASGVGYGPFALGSGLGALLWSALWVGGGASVGHALQSLDPMHLLVLAGVLVVGGLLLLARRTLMRVAMAVRAHSWVTWPNAVTLARLVLTVPLCLWLLDEGATGDATGAAPGWVVAVAVVWAGSDWLDGALARRLGQVTRVGEVLDPVADRLGVLALCLSLAAGGHLPWWPVLLIALTDAVVTLLAGPAAADGDLAVSRLGKVRTAVLLGGLCLALTGVLLVSEVRAAGTWAVGLGAVVHVFAGAGYVARALGSARRPPRRPTPGPLPLQGPSSVRRPQHGRVSPRSPTGSHGQRRLPAPGHGGPRHPPHRAGVPARSR
ncbi:CDP-alcohol phosphatidyltransferase family protein [Ornithinimicrobium murale]|uniref:CDP-alcohol phosphatidyltransferase family protein n=1 Tax=Ornithinimicrobium murale TaxID=1050153 RepID=UPI000E0DD773|nr:CDP-alcohol phosphatidyltransferase family protein [Ornithinimicrobium murale]